MKLHIQDFLQIVKADIDIADSVTLIAGNNGEGKSTTLMALASLITGEGLPHSELKKKDARLLINDKGNAKAALATLAWDAGTAVVKWPACKVEAPEKLSSVYAAGLKEPTKIPAHELTKLLKILPTKEQFVAELEDIALEVDNIADVIEGVWKKIQESGWDAAHDQAVNRRQSLKQEWARVAGLPWVGDKAAGDWVPDNYLPGKSLEELDLEWKANEKIYEFALKSEALNEHERKNLENLAAQEPDLQKNIQESADKITELDKEIAKAESLMTQLPGILNPQKVYHCWSCNAANALKGERLVEPPKEVSVDDMAAANNRYQQQQSEIRQLQTKRQDEAVNKRSLQNQLAASQSAQKKLKETDLDASSDISAEDARVAVELSRSQITAFNIRKECREIFDSHAISDYLAAVLSPDGLRKIVLGAKLQEFNDLLAVICENAEWPPIVVDEFLEFRFDGYPFVLLSTGKRYAVNAALQIAFAKLDGSKVLIFDGVDIMGNELRSGLLNLLQSIPLRSVVGCRYDSLSEIPEELKSVAYWCAGGTVTPLQQAVGVR